MASSGGETSAIVERTADWDFGPDDTHATASESPA
jgi:hypothetical protein